MDTEKREGIEKNKEKYIWLHRLNVSLFLFAILKILSKLLNNTDINIAFIPLVILFLLYSLFIDYNFLFSKNFYTITMLFSGFMSTASAATFQFLHGLIEKFGTDTISIFFFILISSVIIFIKVFEMKLNEI